MKTFILILFIKAGYAGGLATAEFIGEDACKNAGNHAVASFDGLMAGDSRVSRGAEFVCVDKGD